MQNSVSVIIITNIIIIIITTDWRHSRMDIDTHNTIHTAAALNDHDHSWYVSSQLIDTNCSTPCFTLTQSCSWWERTAKPNLSSPDKLTPEQTFHKYGAVTLIHVIIVQTGQTSELHSQCRAVLATSACTHWRVPSFSACSHAAWRPRHSITHSRDSKDTFHVRHTTQHSKDNEDTFHSVHSSQYYVTATPTCF